METLGDSTLGELVNGYSWLFNVSHDNSSYSWLVMGSHGYSRLFMVIDDYL